jgi:hypothetical protein
MLQVSKNSQKGQMLLIVVLVMVVALSVGLSIASRSITNLRITSEQANSQKAFTAAESGIEEAIKIHPPGSAISNGPVIANEDLGNNANISQVDIQEISNTADILINNGNFLGQDDGADIWLTTYNSDPAKLYLPPYWSGNLTIYWGSSADVCSATASQNTQSAIELIVMSGTRTAPQLNRYGFDACTSPARQQTNHFTLASVGTYTLSTTDGTKTFHYSATVPAITNGLIARIIPLYAGTKIWVHATTPFPSQGRIVTATGTSDTTTRKVSYFQGYETLPSEFFYSVFSPKP